MFTNKSEAAEAKGITSFDCALPQDMLDAAADELAAATGESRQLIYDELRDSVVMAYRWTDEDGVSHSSVWGSVVAVLPEGVRLLKLLDAIRSGIVVRETAREAYDDGSPDWMDMGEVAHA